MISVSRRSISTGLRALFDKASMDNPFECIPEALSTSDAVVSSPTIRPSIDFHSVLHFSIGASDCSTTHILHQSSWLPQLKSPDRPSLGAAIDDGQLSHGSLALAGRRCH